MKFKSKRPHFEHLKNKWMSRHNEIRDNLFDKHLRRVALGSLGGLMLLNTPGMQLSPQQLSQDNETKVTTTTDNNALLAAELKTLVPGEMRSLNQDEEKQVGELLSKHMNAPVAAQLQGKRLNRSYGVIGGEQHLYRYPGDTLQAHARDAQDWSMYGSSGIAPGLGAWGYFASSKSEFSEKVEERERYYLATQTFLAPGFAENTKEYKDFFKFRKMLVVNPKTGQSVVAVIGDAGPAEWTGKHLGGSPEVMHFLGLAKGPRKGAVLYFFIDDPEDKIPLGPVNYNDGGFLANR